MLKKWILLEKSTNRYSINLYSHIDPLLLLKYLKFDISNFVIGGTLIWVYCVTGDNNNQNDIQNTLENLSNNFDTLLRGLEQLIERFNSTVVNNNIGEIEVVDNRVGIVDYDMDEQSAQVISNMLDIIRDTIHQRTHQIEDLLEDVRIIDEQTYQSLLTRFESTKELFTHWH